MSRICVACCLACCVACCVQCGWGFRIFTTSNRNLFSEKERSPRANFFLKSRCDKPHSFLLGFESFKSSHFFPLNLGWCSVCLELINFWFPSGRTYGGGVVGGSGHRSIQLVHQVDPTNPFSAQWPLCEWFMEFRCCNL